MLQPSDIRHWTLAAKKKRKKKKEGKGKAGNMVALSVWTVVQISRPGFWFVTIWCYVAGLRGQGLELATSSATGPMFWAGLAYVALPLNLLLYSWNDYDDVKLDERNPRKGRYLLGTAGVKNEPLRRVFWGAMLLNVAFLAGFATVAGAAFVAKWFALACATNFLYNDFPRLRAGPPPLDLCVGPLGYALVVPLAARINGLDAPGVASMGFHISMILRSQLWGQIIDFGPDMAAGRRTTAVTIGSIVKVRVLLAAIVACELGFALFGVQDVYVAAFSALCLAQALVEVFLYPAKPPSLGLAALTGAVMTPTAGLLLMHVFSNPVFL